MNEKYLIEHDVGKGKPPSCDVCGKKCIAKGYENNDNWKECAIEYIVMHGIWGYCSNRDQETHECIICDECYETIRNFIKSIGGNVRIYQYDMLTLKPLDRLEDCEQK